MRIAHPITLRFCSCLFGAGALLMGQPAALTLEQAKQLALKNHPRIQSAGLSAEAANKVVTQARAPFYPVVTGNATGALAQHGTTMSAGALTTSSLYSRTAVGVGVGQLVTDFGRTSSLTEVAKLKAAAQGRNVDNTREQVLVEVSDSYYQALGADAVLKAAQAAVDNRSVT